MYEYLVIRIIYQDELTLECKLNELGNKSWELVFMEWHTNFEGKSIICTFKRLNKKYYDISFNKETL